MGIKIQSTELIKILIIDRTREIVYVTKLKLQELIEEK